MKALIPLLVILCLNKNASSQTWSQVTPTVSNNFNACWFSPVHPDTGYISGYSIISGHFYPFVFKTLNGGVTVTNQGLALGQNFLNPGNMDFTSESTGYIAGWGMIKTSDGGVNWNICLDMGVAGGPLWDIKFESADTGYSVGQSFLGASGGYEGQFLTTYDAGVNWTSAHVSAEVNLESSELKALLHPTANHFYAGGIGAGYTTLFESVDDGLTWSGLPFSESITSMALANSDTAYIAGELGIYRICIPQNTITLVQSIVGTTINSIRIKDQLGFAVTFDGDIYASGDNGRSWFQMTSPVQGTHPLNQISIVSQNEAWAVGGGGTILHYTANGLPLNIKNEEEVVLINIYPNPAHNSFSIRNNNKIKGEMEIIIRDILGKFLFQRVGVVENEQVVITDLTPGVYTICIRSEKVCVVKRLVIR